MFFKYYIDAATVTTIMCVFCVGIIILNDDLNVKNLTVSTHRLMKPPNLYFCLHNFPFISSSGLQYVLTLCSSND